MKKYLSLLILLVSGSLSISAIASTSQANMYFTSIAQAQQYCPALDALVFTQTNPNSPNGTGTIYGTNNNVNFQNSSTSAPHPQNVDSNDVIQNVQFRDVSGIYGSISGKQINCFYSYPTFTGANFGLIMQGKTS